MFAIAIVMTFYFTLGFLAWWHTDDSDWEGEQPPLGLFVCCPWFVVLYLSYQKVEKIKKDRDCRRAEIDAEIKKRMNL